jgi:surface protein
MISARFTLACCCFSFEIPPELRDLIHVYLVEGLTNPTISNAVKSWNSWNENERRRCIMRFGFIAEWDTRKVTIMRGLFQGCVSFNININNWDVSNVSDMSETFLFAKSFNEQLDR